jgi:hypothetical protein
MGVYCSRQCANDDAVGPVFRKGIRIRQLKTLRKEIKPMTRAIVKVKSNAIVPEVVKDAVLDDEPDAPIQIQVSDFGTAKAMATWGTYGKSGKDPLKYVRLVDCETPHLQAILKTQWQIANTVYEKIIKSILDDRRQPYVNPDTP